jgi:hypothetical protein
MTVNDQRNYLYDYDICQKRRRKHHQRRYYQGRRQKGLGVHAGPGERGHEKNRGLRHNISQG